MKPKGGFWHKMPVQPEAIVGTETGGLPTFGVERWLAKVHRATTKRPPYLQQQPTTCDISLNFRQHIIEKIRHPFSFLRKNAIISAGSASSLIWAENMIKYQKDIKN